MVEPVRTQTVAIVIDAGVIDGVAIAVGVAGLLESSGGQATLIEPFGTGVTAGACEFHGIAKAVLLTWFSLGTGFQAALGVSLSAKTGTVPIVYTGVVSRIAVAILVAGLTETARFQTAPGQVVRTSAAIRAGIVA